MNREVIERIGELHPPAVPHALNFASSITLNMFGGAYSGIYVLCEDGQIRHMNINGSGSDYQTEEAVEHNEMHLLELDDVESLLDMNFSGLEFNFSGSILLLSGVSSLAVVFLPKISNQVADSLPLSTCQLMMLYQANLPKDEIAKVMWHPLSDKHIVVLLKTNKLMMFDVVEGTESEYLLDASKTYTSFCFGTSIDWMSLTVFLLDSRADITCMCPLLPTGAVVPTDTIRELHEWLSDSCIDRMNPQYLQRVDAYLRAAFGALSLDEEQGRGGAGGGGGWGGSELRRAGIHRGRPLRPDQPLHECFYRQPLLQGPLVVEGRMKKRSGGSSRQGQGVPCDICMPAMAGEDDPVALFVVSWSDGVIEQFVMGDAFGPGWSGDGAGDDDESLCFGNPALVHVETLCLAADSSSASYSSSLSVLNSHDNVYTLQCDPLDASNFHVTARNSGEAFLLHLDWIANKDAAAIDSDNKHHHHHHNHINNHNNSNKQQLQNSASLPESTAHLIFKHPLPQHGICGRVLLSDPLFGHVAVLRGDDGLTAAVNLRVEEKLMLLDSQIRLKDEQLLAPFTRESSAASSINRSADALLASVSAALKTVPMATYSDEEASAAKYGEALKNSILYLGREVIDPLEQFECGMKFAKDSLRETYRSQYAALHGTAPEHVDGDASSSSLSLSASSASLTASPSGKGGDEGLLKQYETAKRRHVELKTQLDALGAKLSKQKEVAASSLHFSKRHSLRAGLTRAEELYSLQVQRWGAVCQRLDVSLARARDQVEDSCCSRPELQDDGEGEGEGEGERVSSSSTNKNSNKKVTSTRKTKNFMTPTKPRSVASSLSSNHISSPHRISYRHSPATGKPCRVLSSSGGGDGDASKNGGISSAAKRNKNKNNTSPMISLHDDEKNSCAQLQQETGNLHQALRLQIKTVEERLSRLYV